MANRLGRLLSEIHYCYQCFEWVVGEKWEPHCRAHLDALTSKRCGTVTYCHTLVRPGYCPFCLGKISLSTSDRLKPWSRDHKLWLHVKEEHLTDCQWPLVCPHPRCSTTHDDSTSFQFHLIDVHKFSRSRPTKGTSSTGQHSPGPKIPIDGCDGGARPGRKRKRLGSSGSLEWTPPQSLDPMAVNPKERLPYRPPKRNRQSPPALVICPEVIMIDEDMSDDQTARCDVESVTLFPPSPLSVKDDNQGNDLERGPSPLLCTTPNGAIYMPKPADSDNGSDWDVPFDQYLRSPSPSPSPPPSPDRAASELSGATLADVECGRGTVPPTETSVALAPEDMLEGEVARDQDTCRITSGPRIRLRVSQPRITLRLKLQNTSPRRKNKEKGKNK